MHKQDVLSFFERLKQENPNPVGELLHTNTFTLLVAVILSAQSTDAGVNRATKKLFEKIKTPEDMLALGEDTLKSHIKTIGLYHTKAKNVIKTSQMLVDTFNSQVPHTKKDLTSLPGVGVKTANVVLNIAFGKETFAVDTHVFRVANRTGLAPGKTPEDVEKKLDRIVPHPYRLNAHHWLILHGRYICKAKKPLCPSCPVSTFCQYPEKTKS